METLEIIVNPSIYNVELDTNNTSLPMEMIGNTSSSQGPIGPQGPQGEKGEKGNDGLKGDKGDKGDDGVGSPSWIDYAASWSTPPSFINIINDGDVYRYTNGNTTIFRLVPTPYNPKNDAFYRSFNNGILNDLIVKRGD